MTAAAPSAAEYARNAAEKESGIRAVLTEQGLQGVFRGMRRSPLDDGYRMRASLYLDPAGPLGVDPRSGRRPLEETLWVLPRAVRERAEEIARVLGEARAETGVTGCELRVEFGTERLHLTVAARRDAPARAEDTAERLLALGGVLGAAVPAHGVELGEAWLRHQLLGRTLLAHYLAFFQTNQWLTPQLAAAAGEAADDPARIVDLYCGVGLHALLAARPDSEVLGVDTNRWAIESAQRNAALLALPRARFERIPAERLAGRAQALEPSVLFINPSRYGCAPGLPERIARWRPRAVSLVSCSIASHARDLAAFAQAGYQPQPFESFDMFPFTAFVESVTTLLPAGV